MSSIYDLKLEPIKIPKGKGAINRYKLYTKDGEAVQFSYIVDAQEALDVVDEDGNKKYFIDNPNAKAASKKDEEIDKPEEKKVRNENGTKDDTK